MDMALFTPIFNRSLARLASIVGLSFLLISPAFAGTIRLQDEGTTKGYPWSLDFQGTSVTASMSGSEGVVAITGSGITSPGTTTDNAIVRWNGTDGSAIQDYTSNAPTITDAGLATFVGAVTCDGVTMDANEVITLGSQELDHDGTDFVFDDSVDIGGSGTSTFGGEVEIGGSGTSTFGGSIEVTGDINPEADGTRDLGTQTTAQWANVWSDLINGSDYSFVNDWRMLESEKYEGYPIGIAFDTAEGFESGVITETVEGTPLFVICEDFIEYKGVRVTAEQLKALLE